MRMAVSVLRRRITCWGALQEDLNLITIFSDAVYIVPMFVAAGDRGCTTESDGSKEGKKNPHRKICQEDARGSDNEWKSVLAQFTDLGMKG